MAVITKEFTGIETGHAFVEQFTCTLSTLGNLLFLSFNPVIWFGQSRAAAPGSNYIVTALVTFLFAVVPGLDRQGIKLFQILLAEFLAGSSRRPPFLQFATKVIVVLLCRNS